MEKIKFVADTASDIPDEYLWEYGIDMPSVPIGIDGKEYFERKSFSMQEFYNVLAKSKEIPVTSRVPEPDFYDSFERAYLQEYNQVITVTINGGGSGTYTSALMARERFYKEHPEAHSRIQIHIIDSKTYAIAYGYPVIQGAKMAEEGKSAAEILAYLEEWFSSVEIYLGCYSLDYAKKSGRINAAAAFVGDILGLRPIISLIDGDTKIVEKVRGDKQVIPKIVELYRRRCGDPAAPVLVVRGEIDEYGRELQAALKKELGREPELYYAGASISINSGPKIVAVVLRGEPRR